MAVLAQTGLPGGGVLLVPLLLDVSSHERGTSCLTGRSTTTSRHLYLDGLVPRPEVLLADAPRLGVVPLELLQQTLRHAVLVRVHHAAYEAAKLQHQQVSWVGVQQLLSRSTQQMRRRISKPDACCGPSTSCCLDPHKRSRGLTVCVGPLSSAK